MFTVVWGRESAKLKEIPSLSKMGIFQEAAFQVMKNDQRIFKQKQLYLKCIHTNAAGVKRNLGIADVLLDPNVSLFKKVSYSSSLKSSFYFFFINLTKFVLFVSGTHLPIN